MQLDLDKKSLEMLSFLFDISEFSTSQFCFDSILSKNKLLIKITQEKLDVVLRKIKNKRSTGLNEIPAEIWKTRKRWSTAQMLQRNI